MKIPTILVAGPMSDCGSHSRRKFNVLGRSRDPKTRLCSYVSPAKNQDMKFRLGWQVSKNLDLEKGQGSFIDQNIQECEYFPQGIGEGLS
jgi:hypothetical protein